MFNITTRTVKRLNGRFCSSDLTSQYRRALAAITDKNSPERDVSSATKLKLYGYFKQIETGPCTAVRPGMFDPVGRAKHDSWAALANMSKDEAMKGYVKEALQIFDGKLPESPATNNASASSKVQSSQTANSPTKPASVASIAFPKLHLPHVDSLGLTTIEAKAADGGVQHVVLNRPKRGNAFDMKLWEDYRRVFEAVGNSEDVRVVVLSGAGGNFSTGMDLSVFAEMQSCGSKESCEGRRREGIAKFIQYLQDATSAPETCAVPVIAAIAGHCIGGAIDIITACDLRYCTKDASFCVKEIDLAIVSLILCVRPLWAWLW
jgi:acyl-CoA-binding protein